MNMLNNDFDTILTEDPTVITRPKPSIDEFRARYLSTRSDPIEDEKITGKVSLTDTLPVGDGASFTDAYESYYRAGTVGTLFQKTYVLSERMAKNYSRNLLAYGVRAGMYGGKLYFPLRWNLLSLLCRYGAHVGVCIQIFRCHVFHLTT